MRSYLARGALALLFAGYFNGAALAKPLVYCMEGSPETFGPAIGYLGPTITATAGPVYDRLLEFKRGSTEVGPGLAESYAVSADGRTYTFKLRQGVKFQTTAYFTPTRDFNADDVLFTINRQWKDDHPYHKVGGDYKYFNEQGLATILDKVEKVDDRTLTISIKEPLAFFPSLLAEHFMSIYSAEYGEQLLKAGTPDKIDSEPVGTGPFQFVSYKPDAVIRYKANAAHNWGDQPKVDPLLILIVKDPSVRWSKLRAGECDVMAYPSPADLPAMQKDPNVKIMQQPGLNVGYVTLNTQKKPLNDVRVRQALNHAVDRDTILRTIYGSSAVLTNGPVPPTLWGYNPALKAIPYDLAKAKALLAEAGYPDGFEMELWAMPVSRPYNPNGKRMAELLQADWAKVGVKIKIVTYEFGEYLKRLRNGEGTAVEIGWIADYPDPDDFLYPLLSCVDGKPAAGNDSSWCNAEFTKLVVEGRASADQAKRQDLYIKAQELFEKEMPWIPLVNSLDTVAMRKGVENYVISPMIGARFGGLEIK